MDLPSYFIGLVTGVVGSLIVMFISGYSIKKHQMDSIDSTLTRVNTLLSQAMKEASSGNYGNATTFAKKAQAEWNNLANEISIEEAFSPDETESESLPPPPVTAQ